MASYPVENNSTHYSVDGAWQVVISTCAGACTPMQTCASPRCAGSVMRTAPQTLRVRLLMRACADRGTWEGGSARVLLRPQLVGVPFSWAAVVAGGPRRPAPVWSAGGVGTDAAALNAGALQTVRLASAQAGRISSDAAPSAPAAPGTAQAAAGVRPAERSAMMSWYSCAAMLATAPCGAAPAMAPGRLLWAQPAAPSSAYRRGNSVHTCPRSH